MTTKRITPQTAEAIWNLHIAAHNRRQIAERLGVPKHAVQRVIQGKRQNPDKRLEEARAVKTAIGFMYKNGSKFATIKRLLWQQFRYKLRDYAHVKDIVGGLVTPALPAYTRRKREVPKPPKLRKVTAHYVTGQKKIYQDTRARHTKRCGTSGRFAPVAVCGVGKASDAKVTKAKAAAAKKTVAKLLAKVGKVSGANGKSVNIVLVFPDVERVFKQIVTWYNENCS